MKKILGLALLGCIALTGCASLNQAVGGYQAAAVTGIQGANDNIINAWTVTACATPFSAAVRNPQIIPALRVLCLPGGTAASGGAVLLDGVAPAK